MKTVKGIYLDLSESEYKYNYEGLTFYFSSVKYLEKFESNVEKFITEETMKLEIKYKIYVDFRKYLAISYYKQIEKRGFRISYFNREFTNNLQITNLLEQ